MAQDESDYFRIGMLGPSGVGKTSLVTAILQESLFLMASGQLVMRPVGTPTEDRLNRNERELNEHLVSGEFNTEAVHGTTDAFSFMLQVAHESQPVINVELRDFPGVWLAEPDRRARASADWEGLLHFLAAATVLLIPVDSVLVMESSSTRRREDLAALAALDEMRTAVGHWAAERGLRPDEPAVMMICPVKCESYFADNGGDADLSGELRQKIIDVYADVLQTVRRTVPEARILYAPVDTMGCVELTSIDWHDGLDVVVSYRIREPERISRAGARDVVWALYRHLFQVRRATLAGVAEAASRRAQELEEVPRPGLLLRFWQWLTGRRAAQRQAAQAAAVEAAEAESRVKELGLLLRGIGGPAHGPRVRDLSHRMRVYVRTRGRVSDYQFIGEAPTEAWWRAYRDVTDLELPSVLVESDGQAWRAYVSGLRSQRLDSQSRTIYLDLVLHGECNPADGDDHNLALAIITALLGGQAGEGRGELPAIPIDDGLVESWLAEPAVADSLQIAGIVRDAFRGFAAPSAVTGAPAHLRWLGGLGSERNRVDFMALTRRLLGGATGRALMLSHIASLRDAGKVVEQQSEGELGVLVSRRGPLFKAEATPL